MTFLSRVLKYREDTLLSILYFHIKNKQTLMNEIKEIKKLYFQINPRNKNKIDLNEKRINDLIIQTPSYILNNTFLADELSFNYQPFLIKIRPFCELKSQIETKKKMYRRFKK